MSERDVKIGDPKASRAVCFSVSTEATRPVQAVLLLPWAVQIEVVVDLTCAKEEGKWANSAGGQFWANIMGDQ